MMILVASDKCCAQPRAAFSLQARKHGRKILFVFSARVFCFVEQHDLRREYVDADAGRKITLDDWARDLTLAAEHPLVGLRFVQQDFELLRFSSLVRAVKLVQGRIQTLPLPSGQLAVQYFLPTPIAQVRAQSGLITTEDRDLYVGMWARHTFEN